MYCTCLTIKPVATLPWILKVIIGHDNLAWLHFFQLNGPVCPGPNMFQQQFRWGIILVSERYKIKLCVLYFLTK